MKRVSKFERAIRIVFLVSVGLLLFVYGVLVGKFHLFPYHLIELATVGYREVQYRQGTMLPWYYARVHTDDTTAVRGPARTSPGLNMVVHIKADEILSVKVVGMDGEELHEWQIDWFEIWPHATHVPRRLYPKSRPGTHIHGAVIMENGDLVFNFEHLGLVRLDREGRVVWKLPYQTHHSVHRNTDGGLWVCGQKEHSIPSRRFPNRVPPFEEYTILVVSPEGSILEEWSVAELLEKNGRQGLMHLGSLDNWSTQMRGDHLHLNDAEPFPDELEEGYFERGDVLVSLRNVNTVFVFNRHTERIKHVCTGRFVRQHDPDFLDGHRYSVFDNNGIVPGSRDIRSRIVIVHPQRDGFEVYFEGSRNQPFGTVVMGKHQWLADGHLLITDSCAGRAFEIDEQKQVVWEFINHVDAGIVGLVEEVQRLPVAYASLFRD